MNQPINKVISERKKGRPPNICSTDFSINWGIIGKKPEAFLVGVWRSKQGEGVHIF